MSSEEELSRLTLKLDTVKEKFIKEWTGESFDTAQQQIKDVHINSLKEGKDNIAQLEQLVKEYQDQSDKKLQELQNQANEITQLEKELKELHITAENLLEKKNQEQQHLDWSKEQVNKVGQDLTAKEQAADKNKQYTKGVEYFSDRLGLVFKKIDEEHLQFVFKYINPKDWEQQFVFTVHITNSGEYRVTDCLPNIVGLPNMVEQLQRTNNFSKFVIGVRQKFKEHVTACQKTT